MKYIEAAIFVGIVALLLVILTEEPEWADCPTPIIEYKSGD